MCDSCLQSYWRQHSVARHDPSLRPNKNRTPARSEDPISLDDDKLLSNDDSFPIPISSSAVVTDDVALKDWTVVCTEKAYIPTRDDIGCILRIEVKAIANSDGQVLAGPIVVVTEPVLSAPKPPPKRGLVTITGSTSGGGTRFRVVSYNVLAELYATKQVCPHLYANHIPIIIMTFFGAVFIGLPLLQQLEPRMALPQVDHTTRARGCAGITLSIYIYLFILGVD